MGKQDEIILKVENVVFDTAKSFVHMVYDTKDGYLSVKVFSHFSETHQSTKEWMDMVSYGQCILIIDDDDFDTLREIADCIKDKDWLRIHNNEKTLFKDESIKRAVLERLYNAGDDQRGLIYCGTTG